MRAPKHAHNSLSVSLSLPFFPPQALMTVDVVGSLLPSLQKRERGSLGSAPTPVVSHQNVDALHSRPDHWPSIHFASWNVLFMHSLGQSKYKSKSNLSLIPPVVYVYMRENRGG